MNRREQKGSTMGWREWLRRVGKLTQESNQEKPNQLQYVKYRMGIFLKVRGIE